MESAGSGGTKEPSVAAKAEGMEAHGTSEIEQAADDDKKDGRSSFVCL